MKESSVIYQVKQIDRATPLVAQKNKGVRICGDYLVTINAHLKAYHYPVSLTEDISAAVAGGTVFTILDLSKAYLQLELKQHSQEILTVNTHLGLFRFRRLPYGVASAPALFQSVIDQILRGIPSTACYIDDVLISGRTREEYAGNTEHV